MNDHGDKQELWHFALRSWQRPGVEPLALTLQERWNLPVCLLLTAFWLASRGLRPDQALAGQLCQCARLWESQRVQPLRDLRRLAASRPQWSNWKLALQEAELEAERLLLDELQSVISEFPLAQTDVPVAEAWMLLVAPDMAGCEELAENMLELGRLLE